MITQSLNQDVFSYFDIQKPQIINALFSYFQQNNGSSISINKLARDLETSNQTVTLYINILDTMSLIYPIYNTTNSIKKSQSSKKFYVSSTFGLLEPKYDIQTALGFAVESYLPIKQLVKNYQIETISLDGKIPACLF